MVGNPLRAVVVQLPLELKYLSAKIEVFRDEASAFVLESPDSQRLARVDFGEISILPQKFSPDCNAIQGSVEDADRTRCPRIAKKGKKLHLRVSILSVDTGGSLSLAIAHDQWTSMEGGRCACSASNG